MFFLIRVNGNGLRFLNGCAKEGIGVIAPVLSEQGVCCRIRRIDLSRARALARETGASLSVLESDGISRNLHRLRKRLGLIVWPVFVTGLLLFSQCFAWTITVNGSGSIPESLILHTAEEAGLKKGIFLPSLDFARAADHILSSIPSVAYCAVNRIGATVEIEIKEGDPIPPILPDTPCNITAAETGRIVYMEVTSGEAVVSPGDTVGKDQLIISGVTETADGRTQYTHASGKIIADARFSHTFTLPLRQTEEIPTGKTRTRRYLLAFGREIPLFLPQKGGLWKENGEIFPISVGKITLPFGIRVAYGEEYTEAEQLLSEDEALSRLKEGASAWELENLTEAEILSREETAEKSGETMELIIRYTARMEIGKSISILSEEADEKEPGLSN